MIQPGVQQKMWDNVQRRVRGSTPTAEETAPGSLVVKSTTQSCARRLKSIRPQSPHEVDGSCPPRGQQRSHASQQEYEEGGQRQHERIEGAYAKQERAQ